MSQLLHLIHNITELHCFPGIGNLTESSLYSRDGPDSLFWEQGQDMGQIPSREPAEQEAKHLTCSYCNLLPALFFGSVEAPRIVLLSPILLRSSPCTSHHWHPALPHPSSQIPGNPLGSSSPAVSWLLSLATSWSHNRAKTPSGLS